MKLVIEADGGSRGNPGIAGSGTVIYEADGTTVVRKLAYVVGTATNNVAEYHALYNGLCVAQQLGATDISVRMDSKLVVEQMSGRWKIKHPDMRELALKCQKILRTLHSAEFTWVPRRQNAAADALANLAMDAGATGHPIGFLTLDNDATEDVTETADIADITPTMATPMTDAAGSKATAAETPAPTTWNGATTNATRMLLLRHGQTTMSRRRQYSGLSNPSLTELGEWQASRAARRIAAADDIPTVIVASPLARCQQTARAVADLLNLPVRTEPGLVELDFGQWDGLTFAQADAADPKLHAQWLLDPTLPAPGGESLVQAHERVTAARKRLQERYQGCTILVVSHVTPIKSILGQALDATANIYHRLHLDLASLSIAEFYADGPTCVRLVNDTSYLKVQSI